ncbi:MAG: CDP-diacylglycerol--serine O-phosphatidyltransferase [Ignavibacteria bacterium]|nr:CDP-diacylglycerol--serine O-phosphatidyltransferase [Ignavibacteria bacterium]
MKITRAVVPSLFTVLNVVCGFLSIVNAAEGAFVMSAWFVVLAAVFDSLDGVMARITRSSSQFGVELDSLADVVSFGAAPSFLVYQIHLQTLNTFGIIISAMPLVFGAIRLARFNVQLVGFEKEYFKGLPIPFAAITICAYVLQYYSEEHGLHGWSAGLLAPLVIVLALLMVSRVKYDAMPKFSRKGLKTHPWRAIVSVVAAAVVLVSGGRLLFPVLIAAIAIGIGRSAFEWIRGLPAGFSKEEEESEVSSIDI